MKIRTQLVLVCFLIAVVPLSALVVYSYYSSRRALEDAYHGEATRMSSNMDRRLGMIRSDLEQRLAEVSSLPALQDAKASEHDVRNIVLAMGESAPLFDSLEIQPLRMPEPEVKINAMKHAEAPAVPPVAAPAPPAVPREPAKPSQVVVEVPKLEPIVIDIPTPSKLPRFTMTDEQKAQLGEIRRLGRDLGTKWNQLTPEQQADMQKQLDAVQQQFNQSIQRTQQAFHEQLAVALKQREDDRRMRLERHRALLDARKNGPPGSSMIDSDAADVDMDIDLDTQPAPAAVPVVAAAATPAPTAATPVASPARAPKAAVEVHRITPADSEKLLEQQKKATLLLGRDFNVPLHSKGNVVAKISAHVSTEEVIRRVLGASGEDRSEIAFAVDRDGNLYARIDDDRQKLEALGVRERVINNKPFNDIEDWIVVLTKDPQSGLRVGVARPVGESFVELRKTAAKNFGVGMALVAWLLIGIAPIANHMTRDVKLVTLGAERIAKGDLMTRVPVKSKNEFGQLATAFNRMAEDLSLHQQTIVTQERVRQEQSLQQRLLEVEYTRKSDELEEARRFQLSMLPKHVPQLAAYDIAVFTQTAAEVGGDYYDFHVTKNGLLTAAIGDATGHGARAGTMVTVIKALFAGYAPDIKPSAFLNDAAEKVKRMDLGRMAMALLVARFDGDRVTLGSAGMPPAYVHRAASGEVEEVALHATPLGTLTAEYHDAEVALSAGDTLLLMTDGFPELLNSSGQQLGYVAAMEEFERAAAAPTADAVIAELASAAKRWSGVQAPNDDVTFVVIRQRA